MARISVHPPRPLRHRPPRHRPATRLSRRRRLDSELRDLAVLAATASIGCARWLDFGSWAPSTRDQLLAEKISTIPDWPDSPVFTELERLVMLYAEVMTVAPALVTDDLVARLRRNLGDAELVELTALIADESLRSWVGGLDRRGPGIAG